MLMRRLLLAALISNGVVVLGACANSATPSNPSDQPSAPSSIQVNHSSGSMAVSAAGSSDGDCESGPFRITADPKLPRGSTPEDAVSEFLAHGSIYGVGPRRSPVDVGFPTTDWTQTELGTGIVEFSAANKNRSTLKAYFVDGYWEVLEGNPCGG